MSSKIIIYNFFQKDTKIAVCTIQRQFYSVSQLDFTTDRKAFQHQSHIIAVSTLESHGQNIKEIMMISLGFLSLIYKRSIVL